MNYTAGLMKFVKQFKSSIIMRNLGIILVIIGLILTLVTGFKFFTKEKVVDVGSIEVSADKPHSIVWSPYLGIGIMVIGGIIFVASRSRRL